MRSHFYFWELALWGAAAAVRAETIPVGESETETPEKPAIEEPAPEPPTPLLHPKSVHRVGGADANEPGRNDLSLSLQFHTPLIAETDFETRFRSWGGGALVSIPLFDISLRAFVHLETGVLGTFTRVGLDSGETYSHGYVDFPLRVRFLYPLTDRSREAWTGELFVGSVFRLIEYDNSSARVDGPVIFRDSGFLEPDIGLGISRGFSAHFRARLLVGYQFLALAGEFGF